MMFDAKAVSHPHVVVLLNIEMPTPAQKWDAASVTLPCDTPDIFAAWIWIYKWRMQMCLPDAHQSSPLMLTGLYSDSSNGAVLISALSKQQGRVQLLFAFYCFH